MKNFELKAYDREKSRFAVSTEEGNDEEPIVSILWVPDVDNFEHDHIELDFDTATKLRDWLTDFINQFY